MVKPPHFQCGVQVGYCGFESHPECIQYDVFWIENDEYKDIALCPNCENNDEIDEISGII